MKIWTRKTDNTGSSAPAPAVPAPAHLASGKYPRPNPALFAGSYRAQKKPKDALVFAIRRYELARHDEERELALALADVMVSGRAAYAKWSDWQTQGPVTFGAVKNDLGPRDPSALKTAFDAVTRRIAEVDRHLGWAPKKGAGARPTFAPSAGSAWIGVHPEADTPRRPVNIGCSAFVQKDVVLKPAGIGQLHVRYVQAGEIDANTKVVIYLHGLGSRGEEADHVARALLRLGNYAVIAPDLPSHGCTTRPSPGPALALPYGKNGNPPEGFPFLERMEKFVAAFVNALNAQTPGLKKQIACLAGGSLGGTIAMRMSMDTSPWRPKSVAFWSPAGLWEPMNEDDVKRPVAVDPRLSEATMKEFLDDGSVVGGLVPIARTEYFSFNFEQPPIGKKNYERWWSQAFLQKYKRAPMRAAITDRLELYGENLRRWQFRLAYEQLCFSILRGGRQAMVGGSPKVGMRPVLMMCGTQDNDLGASIFDRSQDLARFLEARQHPGDAVWIEGAGHSIHDECPEIVAEEIHELVSSFGV